MKLTRVVLIVPLFLAACSQDPSGVRLTRDSVPQDVKVNARVEPVFYNGKTYQVSITPSGDGAMNLSIAGMSAGQGKDATAMSSSVLHHFACKDSQKAMMSGPATFDGGAWKTSGRCG
ncbi:hypothetical protein [Aestuariivirga litoralis]|uniref:hypothetical protein n=1 Tax=Aestuariivirga litoralis TaxID=2650924 RepID=UPI0018C81753|nr:hypothetical protein [Aestuariivirga litoralis]MBG1231933.1 hypothetical protein [Aestuariivirga litoralis]